MVIEKGAIQTVTATVTTGGSSDSETSSATNTGGIPTAANSVTQAQAVTQTSAASQAADQSHSGLGGGPIAGIVIGSVVGTACIAAIGFLFYKRPSRKVVDEITPAAAGYAHTEPEYKNTNSEADNIPSGRLQYPE